VERALCIEHVSYGDDGLTGEENTYPIVHGECGANRACSMGTCETARRCVARRRRPRRADYPSAAPLRAAACSAMPHARVEVASLVLVLLAFGLRFRRRRSNGSPSAHRTCARAAKAEGNVPAELDENSSTCPSDCGACMCDMQAAAATAAATASASARRTRRAVPTAVPDLSDRGHA
jgi:hypothetical protein